jgi:hypothetical protein
MKVVGQDFSVVKLCCACVSIEQKITSMQGFVLFWVS